MHLCDWATIAVVLALFYLFDAKCSRQSGRWRAAFRRLSQNAVARLEFGSLLGVPRFLRGLAV